MGMEWYTLSENLYRAYLITGDRKYRDFARVWEYPEYWDIYGRKGDLFAPLPTANRPTPITLIATLTPSGRRAAYLVTGDVHYLNIIQNAFDYLRSHQVFATGGYGPDEQLLPHAKLLDRLYLTSQTFETQCGSWAAFKLARYLMTFTGDARYGDWVESLLYNAIGASIPMTPDGRVFYYSSYQVDGAQKANTAPDGAGAAAPARGPRPSPTTTIKSISTTTTASTSTFSRPRP